MTAVDHRDCRPIDVVIGQILRVYRAWSRGTDAARMRADWEELFSYAPPDAPLEFVDVGAMRCAWVEAPGARADRIVMYLHGGGFKIGSLHSHHELMAEISRASSRRIFGVDYRLSPEHRFPAALEDTRTAYLWLLAQGHSPANIAFAGDSAGAGLAVSTMLALRDEGLPLPEAGVLMSPWCDMTASGASYHDRAAADPINQRPMILAMAREYLGDAAEASDPAASPLFGRLAGLPPLLIQVGDRETLLSDSLMLAERARVEGVKAAIEIFPGMIHVFQQFRRELIEAREALASIGAFLKACSDQPSNQ